jgi:hypothetical protein
MIDILFIQTYFKTHTPMETRYLPEVATVIPDYKHKAFTVYFKDDNSPLSLNFQNYLTWIMMQDAKLTDYMLNSHRNSTFNDMIQDLYELGYPVDAKLSEFFVAVEDKLEPALLKFLQFMRNDFQEPQDTEGEF